MRAENARLGVETTTRSDLTARSATKPRSSLLIGQWHTARVDRNWLEKAQQPGPRMGSSPEGSRLKLTLVRRIRAGHHGTQNFKTLTVAAGRGIGRAQDFVGCTEAV